MPRIKVGDKATDPKTSYRRCAGCGFVAECEQPVPYIGGTAPDGKHWLKHGPMFDLPLMMIACPRCFTVRLSANPMRFYQVKDGKVWKYKKI